MATALTGPATLAGKSRSASVPSPRAPNELSPQHDMFPFPLTTHVCRPPAAMSRAVRNPPPPETVAGTELPIVVPLPSWPEPLRPQHCTLPSARSAHVWLL